MYAYLDCVYESQMIRHTSRFHFHFQFHLMSKNGNRSIIWSTASAQDHYFEFDNFNWTTLSKRLWIAFMKKKTYLHVTEIKEIDQK